ncbi:glutathione S-transferase family protein [Tropicibacter sp. R16_0]|uniref:glutathione S-transferase family protein n=1 Tax=Tropicibacter sp. R16_0 TaxID=2821102 RepID=UPI001AD9DB18|nr:glutathione S-transferase family protein [Tropicibacter sp. R16_0]MBO9450049.1 glutathione S-transferase family protein [Tropicibacter sp. R16_0]
MLTIWGRKTSSNVQALMWCVGELELPYVRHDVGHVHGGLDTDAFGAMNPNRTVPVLQDGDAEPIWETGAILRYLAATYGDDGFWPQDPAKRVQVDMWAEWAKINIAMEFTVPVFWRVVRTAPRDQDTNAVQAAVRELEHKLMIADRQLAHAPFLAGPKLTLADIQLGHVLYRYYDIEIERADFIHLHRYYDDLCQRPAYREHVMVSYDPLRVS